jgi:hypothetical protein
MVSAIQQQTGDAKERLAEKRARDPAGNLIIASRPRRFSGDFPERAPGKRISHRRPITQPVRPRDSVIHRALVGVKELIDLEGSSSTTHGPRRLRRIVIGVTA